MGRNTAVVEKRSVWLPERSKDCWCGAPADAGKYCTKHDAENNLDREEWWDLPFKTAEDYEHEQHYAVCKQCGGSVKVEELLDTELCVACDSEEEEQEANCNCMDPGCPCNGIKRQGPPL